MSNPKLPGALLLATLCLAGCKESGTADVTPQPVADGLGPGLPPSYPASDTDTSWGVAGHYALTDRSVVATQVDAQNRLLITGSTATGSYVRRLLSNGTIDSTFADHGTLTLGFGDPALPDTPVGLALGTNSDVFLLVNDDLVIGATGAHSYTLVHILANGSVDSSYGGSGAVTDTGQATSFYRATNGNLYVMLNTDASSWGLRRYSDAGVLDTLLGTAGTYSLPGAMSGITGPMAGDSVDVYHDCYETVCGTWKTHFDGDNPPTHTQISADQPPVLQRISVPTSSGDIERVATLAGSNVTSVTLDGTAYDLFVPGVRSVTAYPDGELDVDSVQSLGIAKFDRDGVADNTFATTTNYRGNLSSTPQVGAQASVDTAGGILLSSSNGVRRDTIFDYALSGDIVRLKGSAPLTRPGLYFGVPPIVFDTDHYQITQPIDIRGLGDYVSVPARLTGTDNTQAPGRELSIDGGATWHKGWLWVHNGTQLLVRYPASATLTFGGFLSPNSPGVALGDVTKVEFTGTSASITNAGPVPPATSGAPASGGSGGSFGPAGLAGLLLLGAWRRIRFAART